MTLNGWLLDNDYFAVVAHIRPDGDTIGSALALTSALKRLGKRAACICRDKVPDDLSFLPGASEIVVPENMPFAPKAVLFADVSAFDRAGVDCDFCKNLPTATLDHHGTNDRFSDVNAIFPDAAATGVEAARAIEELGLTLSHDEALCLYAAIATDTGNFSFTNTNGEAFRAAALCADAGIDVERAANILFHLRTASKTRLIGAALSELRLIEGGKIAYTVFTDEMFARCGAKSEETNGIIDFLKQIEGVKAAFTAEVAKDGTRFSLRSASDIDVGEIAKKLGGGGHKKAAGATVARPLDEAVSTVIELLKDAL